MIVNLWSTPRTGSVWYSYLLKSQHPGCLLLTEMFNRYHMNMYHTYDTKLTNHHSYVEGSFYRDHVLVDGLLQSIHRFEPRTRSVQQEEEYLFDLLKQHNKEQILILHNHVEPMEPQIRNYLLEAGENLFVYRKNKREQLASYAIAYSTKQFAAFSESQVSTDVVNDIPAEPLMNLVRRIKVWDSIPKESAIAYEDMDFVKVEGAPVKQNVNHNLRLSENMIGIIDRLATDYENSRNK